MFLFLIIQGTSSFQKNTSRLCERQKRETVYILQEFHFCSYIHEILPHWHSHTLTHWCWGLPCEVPTYPLGAIRGFGILLKDTSTQSVVPATLHLLDGPSNHRAMPPIISLFLISGGWMKSGHLMMINYHHCSSSYCVCGCACMCTRALPEYP